MFFVVFLLLTLGGDQVPFMYHSAQSCYVNAHAKMSACLRAHTYGHAVPQAVNTLGLR